MTRLQSGRLTAWLGFVAAWSLLAYVGNAQPETREEPLYQYETAASGAVGYGVMAAALLLIAGVAGGRARELLALRRPRSWKTAALLALAVLVGTYVVAGLVGAFGLDPTNEQGLLPERWQPEYAGAFAANALVVVGVAPLVEELLFRGLGYSLLAPLGSAVAVSVVAVAFATAHGLVEAFPILAAFGAGLAILRSRTDSVIPGLALHALFNGIAMAVAVTA